VDTVPRRKVSRSYTGSTRPRRAVTTAAAAAIRMSAMPSQVQRAVAGRATRAMGAGMASLAPAVTSGLGAASTAGMGSGGGVAGGAGAIAGSSTAAGLTARRPKPPIPER
jgi:hypothetical protein